MKSCKTCGKNYEYIIGNYCQPACKCDEKKYCKHEFEKVGSNYLKCKICGCATYDNKFVSESMIFM